MSRELDAQVAEAMGFDINGTGWSPSIDIVAAWQVLEYLMKRNPRHDIHIQHLDDEWSVGCCYEENEGGWKDWIYAPTAPEAICRAFLRAMGVEVEESNSVGNAGVNEG